MPTTNSRHQQPDPPNDRRVRYAVVGLGYIAQSALLPAFEHATTNSELRALVTGDPEKARGLSKKSSVPLTYSNETFHKCLGSGEIDAVYIALPNNMHSAYAVSAAGAGVHIICEKPMALDEEECSAMIGAIEENGVKLMIAYRLHFEKGDLHAIEILHSGQLGEPRIFNSTFTMQARKGNIRLRREHGGGSLWDIGVYCINASRCLFRAEPEEVVAFEASGHDERFREVAEAVSAILRFPQGRLASFSCSFGAADVSAYEVASTKESVRVEAAYDYSMDLKLKTTITGRIRERLFTMRDQFGPELVYFSDCILNNRDPEPSGREGLADARIIRALYESFENRRFVRVTTDEAEKGPKRTTRD
jgi:predicted dehydrogenase